MQRRTKHIIAMLIVAVPVAGLAWLAGTEDGLRATGALLARTGRGFADFVELGLADGPVPRVIGAQAEGCSPVAAAFAENRPVEPVRPQTVARFPNAPRNRAQAQAIGNACIAEMGPLKAGLGGSSRIQAGIDAAFPR